MTGVRRRWVAWCVAAGVATWLARPGAAAEGPSPAAQGAAAQAFKLRLDGKAKEAAALLDKAVAAGPDDAAAWYELSRTRFYLKQFDEARSAVDKAVGLKPGSGRYHYLAGLIATYQAVVHARGGQEAKDKVRAEMQKSIAAYVAALKAQADYAEAHLRLVELYNNTPPDLCGDKSKAAEHVKALEKLDPIQAARGKSLLLKTRAEKIALWEAVAAKHPDGAAAHAELGLHYLWDYKGDPAAQHVDKALKLDPSRTDVLLRVALAHSVAKRWAPAEAALRRYLAAAPAQPGPLRAYAQFCLAQVLRRSGRGADAEAAIRKAREIDPDCWTTLRPPPGELFTAP